MAVWIEDLASPSVLKTLKHFANLVNFNRPLHSFLVRSRRYIHMICLFAHITQHLIISNLNIFTYFLGLKS